MNRIQRNPIKYFVPLAVLIGIILNQIALADTQNIPLVEGWNFVAFQIEPEDARIDRVLGDLDVVSVWYYDVIRARNNLYPWLSYDSVNPVFLNDLYELHARRGYWIQMDSPGTLKIIGQLPSESISLHVGKESTPGWNAMGFYSLENNYSVADVLSSYSDTDIEKMINSFWEFNPESQSFVSLGMSSILLPGRAYWLESKQEFDLTPDIEVTPTMLQFGSQGDSGNLQIRNKGQGSIAWIAMATTLDGGHWLGLTRSPNSPPNPVQQLTGTSKFYYTPIYISIDRAGLNPGEYSGRILVYENSFPDFPVIVEVKMTVESIQGDYSGTLVVHTVNGKSIPEISTTVFTSVQLDQLQVTLNIDQDKSLLFPHNTVLSGGLLDTTTSTFSVAGTLTLSPDDEMNPYKHLGKTIHRQMWMQTDAEMSRNDILGGYYQEFVSGLLGESIFVEGNFELRKVSEQPSPFSYVRYGTLQGTVLDKSSLTPLQNVVVILSGGGIQKTIYTSEDGKFSFYVYDSSYLLSFQAQGYGSEQIPIQYEHVNPKSYTVQIISNGAGIPETIIPGMQGQSSSVEWFGFSSEINAGQSDVPDILTGIQYQFLTSLGQPIVGGTRVDGNYIGQSKQAGKSIWTGLTPKSMGIASN